MTDTVKISFWKLKIWIRLVSLSCATTPHLSRYSKSSRYWRKKVMRASIWNYGLKVPLRFRKAGRVRCGGARETNWATCHNRLTPSETKEFLKSPCFFRFKWYFKSLFLLLHYMVYFNKNVIRISSTSRN